jgi:hypothetical protein
MRRIAGDHIVSGVWIGSSGTGGMGPGSGCSGCGGIGCGPGEGKGSGIGGCGVPKTTGAFCMIMEASSAR